VCSAERGGSGELMVSDVDDTECRLQIGDFCCSLRFKDPSYSSYLKDHYKGFISEKEPKLTIDVDVHVTLDNEEAASPSSLLTSKTVNGNDFVFLDGLITGTLNFGEKQCTVSFSGQGLDVVKQFMFMVYYTVLKRYYPSDSKNNFLVHGCAVSKNGEGHVFTGPSESGKSTIATLSSDYKVLNDEIVIIKKQNGSFVVGSTPFRGDFLANEDACAPLKAIFLIKHGNGRNVIKTISRKEFITRFFREITYPESLLSTNREDGFSEMLDFCDDVASEVPFYELQFLPDKSFWDSIAELKLEKRRFE